MRSDIGSGARVATYTLLRVVAGLLFAQHGAQKLFGWFGGQQVTDLLSQLGIAGVLEFVGGLLIAIGLFTRPVAFVVAGEMAVAYFLQHASHGFWPILNRGEPAVLYCFIFLFFAAHGAGPYSLDAFLYARRRELGPRRGGA
ncbi:MAG TPA: DoxX family protein [Longimicrobiales bacterium]|nr:DoxX family protein [Longimicrobiales bacterium]